MFLVTMASFSIVHDLIGIQSARSPFGVLHDDPFPEDSKLNTL